MLNIEVPGWKPLALAHVVLDMNGTIALEGRVDEAIVARIRRLAELVDVHVLTADTFGRASELVGRLGRAELVRLQPGGREAEQKEEFVARLGSHGCAAIGNGANDVLMLRAAALGIGVLGREGMSAGVVGAADVVTADPADALDLLLSPKRLIATLRR